MIHLRRTTKDEVYINFCKDTHILAEIPVRAIEAAGDALLGFKVPAAAKVEINFAMRTNYTVSMTKWWGRLPVVSLKKFGETYTVKTWRLIDILSL